MKTTGTKAEVWAGTAQKTPGKLTKADLMLNAAGKVVSKKQHANGQKQAANLKALPRASRTTTRGLHPSHLKGHRAGRYVREQHAGACWVASSAACSAQLSARSR